MKNSLLEKPEMIAENYKEADTVPPSSGGRLRSGMFGVAPAAPMAVEAKSSTLAEDAAARRLIDALVARGVKTFFGIPGGPVCPVFEAIRLHPHATLVESRHESNAAFAATSYYRASGKVPAVVLTAGPGVTNAVSGIASAYLERTPMLVIAGDVAWANHGGRLAQDSGPEGIDVERMLAPVTTAQVRISRARSAVSQGLACLDAATNPVMPGPALLVLPIDEATKSSPAMDVRAPIVSTTVRPPQEAVEKAARWLAEAERPLIVLGAGCREHAPWIRQLVDLLDVPFVTTPRAKGVVGERHPRSLRNGGMAASHWARRYTAEPVDVALVLGSDLDDTSVGPTPYLGAGGRLIHVDLNPAVFNRNFPTALGITADLGHFADALYRTVMAQGLINGRGRKLMRKIHAESPFDTADFSADDRSPIAPHRAIADLQRAAGPSARFITDIGEHMLFALHYLTAHRSDNFQIQLNLGSMGSGIAGAIGLALADTDRRVICICGDGGMQMSGMEILTAAKHGLPIIYAVFNDSRYNMVHHGMKQLFGQSEQYDTNTVDFTAWARSMGIPGVLIRSPDEIQPALLDELQMAGGPAVLDIRIDRDLRIRGGGRVEALQHMSMLAEAAEKGGA